MTRKLLIALPMALLLIPGVALAAFTSRTASQSATFSTLSIAPVTNLQATASCGPALSLTAKVVLTWTGTTTSGATSYEIRRRLVAVTTAVGTVSIGTNTFTNSGLPVATTYGYRVRTFRGTWFADSSEVVVTTPTICT
ncbi:MAG: hypothetical protein QOK42_962 [Frankiaceae bacterium]|jgi:hypothetical protein|nr:hypothetical protein [Frankiaceae bacterium]MDX6226605.1 hypothetical protein [Frankiales bacterium]